MSMRKRPTQHQADLWIATGELARSPGRSSCGESSPSTSSPARTAAAHAAS